LGRLKAELQNNVGNPPEQVRLRSRHPLEKPPAGLTVHVKPWKKFSGEWVTLPGDVGVGTIAARY